MSYCPTCGKSTYFSGNSHRCPPQWEVRDADDCDDSDWEVVREIDAEDAAREYAQRSDSDGGEGPHERIVLVRELGSTETKRFEITFDYSIDYYAHETA
jgi:hypothetical protein